MRFLNLNILSAIAIGILLFGCGKPAQNESEVTDNKDTEIPDDVQVEQTLYDEVIGVHDEIMPKLEDMMNLKGDLQEKADLLSQDEKQSEKVAEMEVAIKNLEGADEAMMNWMRNFKPQRDNVSHDAVVEYYTKQKVSIDSVRTLMENAMAKGAELIKEE
ncbi:MAG TPA: hypothetical protein PKL31_12060 [Fulvivirga sp.]|nr:hypothetical protein [Fulvivirga sp.]